MDLVGEPDICNEMSIRYGLMDVVIRSTMAVIVKFVFVKLYLIDH